MLTAPDAVPGPDELVVANHAVAVNPVDWIVQDIGRMVFGTGWIETVYNRRRRHSALGQISSITSEHNITTAANQAA